MHYQKVEMGKTTNRCSIDGMNGITFNLFHALSLM